MSVNATDVFSNLGIASSGGNAQRPRSSEMGQDTFLMLMTEQLKNQDPLKPMESNDFLGQLAQFSTVSGIEKMQSGLNALAVAFDGSQALQAASLVGRNALVLADSFELSADSEIAGSVDVPAAGQFTVEIRNADGVVVSTQVMQADGPGPQPFEWDGRSQDGTPQPPGRYSISASFGESQSAIALAPMLAAQIQSVSYSAQGILLNLAGLGQVPLSAVGRIG